MSKEPQFIGADVAQAELAMAVHGRSANCQIIANRAEPIDAWLAQVPAGSVLAMESTGRYGRLLAQAAYAAGLRVYVLNARDVHYYAKALGMRGKTDRLDAQVIARYVAEHHAVLRPWRPAAGVEMQLQELLKRRWVLTQQRVALRQSLSEVETLRETSAQLQQAYERAFEEIDRQLRELTASDAQLHETVVRLETITGFGMQTSILLAALFRRIGFSHVGAVVAYSGLDPRPSESGKHRGERHLSKRGPGQLRRQMYLAALAASRSHALGPLYRQLRARGLAATQALVILARKLLRIAYAVWKTGKAFDASKVALPEACAKP